MFRHLLLLVLIQSVASQFVQSNWIRSAYSQNCNTACSVQKKTSCDASQMQFLNNASVVQIVAQQTGTSCSKYFNTTSVPSIEDYGGKGCWFILPNTPVNESWCNIASAAWNTNACACKPVTTTSKSGTSAMITTTQQVTSSTSTNQPTTSSTSTNQPVTSSTSTNQPTTSSTSTTQSTTSSMSTTQPVTSSMSTTQPVTSSMSTTQPVTSSMSTTQPVTSSMSTTQHVTSLMSTTQPVTSSMSTTQPVTSSMSTTQPVTSSMSTTQPVTSSMSTTQPVTSSMSTTQPVTSSMSTTLTTSTMQQTTTASELVTDTHSTNEPTSLSSQTSMQTSILILFGTIIVCICCIIAYMYMTNRITTSKRVTPLTEDAVVIDVDVSRNSTNNPMYDPTGYQYDLGDLEPVYCEPGRPGEVPVNRGPGKENVYCELIV